MHIDSPVTKRSLARLGFLFVLLATFAAWFGKDGWISYPRKNLRAANQNFPKPKPTLPAANKAVSAEAVQQVRAALQGEGPKRMTLADLRTKWGDPAYSDTEVPADAGPRTDSVAFFVGPYGWAVAKLRADTVQDVQWFDGPKSYGDILAQKIIAATIGLGALVALGFLLREMRLRFVLDDEGLVLPGHGRIAFDRMLDLNDSDFAKKGILRLKYRDATETERTALLDEERIDRFDEIVMSLCEKKSWPIPGAEDATSKRKTDGPSDSVHPQ